MKFQMGVKMAFTFFLVVLLVRFLFQVGRGNFQNECELYYSDFAGASLFFLIGYIYAKMRVE